MRWRALAGGLAVTAVLALGAATALGAFSGDGYETTNFGGVDSATALAIQSDRRIVEAGSTSAGASTFDVAVARFKRGGDIDNSFSGDGQETTEFGGFDGGFDVAIQSNRRIIAVGFTDADGTADFALARYRRGGALDGSFSDDGKQTTDFPSAAVARAVAIQANGRIVVAGGDADDFALARYKANGHLDSSFSGDGKLTTDFGGLDEADGVAIQENGRIVAAGARCSGSGKGGGACAFALARYKANGHRDRSFSHDGRKTVSVGEGSDAEDVAIQPNGRIVAAGSAARNGQSDFAAARFRRNGALDHSFSGDGKKTTDFGDSDSGNALAIQRDGRIVLVGQTQATPTVDFALLRYTARGRLDHSFSGDGKQTTDIGSTGNAAKDVAFQTRRKFIVAGNVGGGSQDFVAARYRRNGQLAK